ncbi:MAG: protein translocase subunit SecF [Proteobacteria bacterium]|nr:protein translocase subunit SecF [Pseudomonadota bacterium]
MAKISNHKGFWLLLTAVLAVIFLTAPLLLKRTRIGLEFRGGYEILYSAQPLQANRPVNRQELLQAARILDKRANGLGMAEPEIRIEDPAQIRVMLAGISARDQASALLQGPEAMPVRLTEKWTNAVGGVLGEADFHDTLRAGGVALGLVLALLVLVYRGNGLIASAGLLSFLWLMLLIFNAIGATLSLAAIVAFVLGLGIASDANILTFERIREEFQVGNDAASATRYGLAHAWRTILDASVSGLIVAAALFMAGIGPIRGFALTTIVSIVSSLVCSVLLVSLLMRLRHPRVARHPDLLRPGAPIPPRAYNRFDILPIAKAFAAATAVFLAVGAWSISTRPFNFDIDFKAGTALDISVFRPISRDEADELIGKSGISAATIAIAGANRDQVAARFDNPLKSDEVAKIVDAFRSVYGNNVSYQQNTADPAVANDLARQAIVAIGLALVLLAAYVTVRFNWRYAVATVVTIANAVFFVFGVFSLWGLEIDVTFIAALLTVIGFSTNDCVVVFDRMRENMRLHPRESTALIASASVVQVARRSALTLATVVICAASLYFLGAEPLQMFSLAIMIGLVCAGASSLLIGVPAWHLLTAGRSSTATMT